MQCHHLKRYKLAPAIKIAGVVIIMFCALSAKAGVGMGEWQLRTPCGNDIDNYSSPGSGYALFMSAGNKYERIDNMQRWYFYKQHIIGEQSTGFL